MGFLMQPLLMGMKSQKTPPLEVVRSKDLQLKIFTVVFGFLRDRISHELPGASHGQQGWKDHKNNLLPACCFCLLAIGSKTTKN